MAATELLTSSRGLVSSSRLAIIELSHSVIQICTVVHIKDSMLCLNEFCPGNLFVHFMANFVCVAAESVQNGGRMCMLSTERCILGGK